MTDALSKSPHSETAEFDAGRPTSDSEDRRRPKARAPYACLWAMTLLCVVFALLVMFLQS